MSAFTQLKCVNYSTFHFYIIYLIEWTIRLFMKGNAYMSISFEREAYRHESDFDYLEQRKHYAWVKYLRKRRIKRLRKKKERKKDKRLTTYGQIGD